MRPLLGLSPRGFGRIGLASLFLASGIGHFVDSDAFVAIVPPYLPSPLALVAISGAFEIAGAIGLLLPATRPAAGIVLILLMIAVFPANLHMALHADEFPRFAPWLLWVRLPLQAVLIAWAWWCSVSVHSTRKASRIAALPVERVRPQAY